MNSPAQRVDRADVRETDDDLTLILGAGGVHVLQLRLRYADMTDELINPAGRTAVNAAGAWSLVGRTLSLEVSMRAAPALGLPRHHQLHLDLPDDQLTKVADALLEILHSECFLLDIPTRHQRS
ncbi:hypothetical protein Cs7R123_74870 [Catellatospora sp. TT07R-123]|uniref:hypothetical protein n=1 Tax=Catellatospora sp. TT07R-123 TaxID=2733863 RepID=UPI001B2D151A|nr:hypothetical protein [Catellatospora sp. TT07R-123]GHJ50145.1 hypothetical protein Cs7R123_74870 [Catellatospora sp. TT07R-123]